MQAETIKTLIAALDNGSEERKDLYNRIEAKDWATYLQATQAMDSTPPQVIIYDDEDEFVEVEIANILPDYEVIDDDSTA